ncbi:VOC family protein [Nocardia sp. NPDC004568]|uniref:VOC family protein n=1 Tax=Nocardia sp. NPDC004568 TaxID=3154551 RepID=UPI0033BCA58E
MAPTIACTTYDCDNAAELANFYAQLLDHPVDAEATEFFATVGRETGMTPPLMFVQVPDRTPGKNSIHLDLLATDLSAEIQRALALGAKHIGDFGESGIKWTTLADPERNLFDIAALP